MEANDAVSYLTEGFVWEIRCLKSLINLKPNLGFSALSRAAVPG